MVCHAYQHFLHAYVPTYQKRANISFLRAQRANKRANTPKACQFFNLACQTCANFQTGVPTCQKVCQFSNHFSKENIFQFLIFSVMANICKFQKYLDNSRKFILRNQEFKF